MVQIDPGQQIVHNSAGSVGPHTYLAPLVHTPGIPLAENTTHTVFHKGGLVIATGVIIDDIVIIHDGIRPLVDETVLTDVIMKAEKYGAAVTSMPYNEQIFVIDSEDETTTTRFIPRETLRRVSTPQAYNFGLLNEKYHEAFEKEVGIYGSHYTNTMMVELGVRLHFAAGSDKNIKLTTQDDLEMFKGYLARDKENWMNK